MLRVINGRRYYTNLPIKSFKCKETQALFLGQRVRRWINVEIVDDH